MRRIIGLAVTLSFVFAGALFGQEADQPAGPSAERISELIKQLDAEKAEVREAATEELRKIGEPALKALEKVLADPPSVEVKFRAQAAIDGIKLEHVRKNALKIDDILAQAKAAQIEEWKSDVLDLQLKRLIETLALETENRELKLPVRLGQAGRGTMGPFVNGGVIREKRVKISHCRSAIVLADTIADVSHADDCIIISRGAACVGHCTNSIVIAGHEINIGHLTNGIVIGCLRTDVSHAHDSVLAGRPLDVSHADGTHFLNAPAPKRAFAPIPGRKDNRSLTIDGLNLGNRTAKNPLEGRLHVTLAIDYDEPIALFKLKDGRGEYVARYGQEIRTPEGAPIDELKAWRLIFAGNRLAIFENGDEIACVRQEM